MKGIHNPWSDKVVCPESKTGSVTFACACGANHKQSAFGTFPHFTISSHWSYFLKINLHVY
ncbi:rCG24791, partial [Rattus norvegicus]